MPARGGLALLGGAALGLAGAAVLARKAKGFDRRQSASRVLVPPPTRSAALPQRRAAFRAAKRLNRAAGTLAFSVLADSAVEHYRGSFQNKVMVTPLVTAALSLATSAHGVADDRPGTHQLRHAVYALAALTGVAGTAFHIYNIVKRPGRFDWQNLFYGAPLGAPMAILLSGLLGVAAEQVREGATGKRPRVLGLPAGRMLAAVTGAGLVGTSGEAALLHFRGAYHDPFMYLPVTVPPIGAALLGLATLNNSERPRRLARFWLRLTALLGLGGVGFHTYGVSRNMGGWANWSQNVLNGPPLPAPPSFTGLALAGLAALRLMEEHADA